MVLEFDPHSGTRVRIPQGARWWLQTWSKTQQVGGKLEQVSCILKLYKACLCISINIKTLVETPRQRTRSGARGIGYIAPIAFQFVYVCMCTYIMYLYVYEVYARIMLVFACISCNHTSRHGKRCHVPEALSHGAAIGGPHSGHPWASRHPLFFALGKCCSDPIWRTPPAARV